jgi:hypothetical protein
MKLLSIIKSQTSYSTIWTQIRSNHDKTTSSFSHISNPKLKGVASSTLYYVNNCQKNEQAHNSNDVTSTELLSQLRRQNL